MRRPTIADVARRARVSTATVSNVMNSRGHVGESVKQRVLDAVQLLGYQPNAIARTLRSARSMTIGVVVPDIASPFLMAVSRAIEDVMASSGYTLILASTGENPQREREVLDVLCANQVDGLILASTGSNASLLLDLKKRRMPVVLIDRMVHGVDLDLVLDDNWSGTNQLLNHLYDCGHRRIGFLEGDLSLFVGSERHEAAVQALTSLGLEMDPLLMYPGDFTFEGGHAGAQALLKLEPSRRPTVIVAASNRMAAGALRALREAGTLVPEDMGIVSFGHMEYFQMLWPPMTVVAQEPQKLGREAATLLLRRIDGQWEDFPRRIKLVPQLCVGESCGFSLTS